MDLHFSASDWISLLCCCAFVYRGIRDIRGKSSWKDPEEYQALHVFSGIAFIVCGIAFFVQSCLRHITLLYALSFGAAMVCVFGYLIAYLCYHGTHKK